MKIKVYDLKKHFPDFSQFDFFKFYGLSPSCCIEGDYVSRPARIRAICGSEKAFFKGTAEGYEEAKKWLEEKRILWLKKMGVVFIDE